MKTQLDPAVYFKFRTRLAECVIEQQRLERAYELIATKRVAAFREAGLDPEKHYNLDDETTTAVEVEIQTS